jgi:hypothetical protein
MIALAGDAGAQGTARSLGIDPSVRSLGRGGASAAVFWDGGSEWVNPALLGYRKGLSFTWDRNELLPDFAGDIVLSSRRVSLGLWGVGFSAAGQPIDVLGGTDLDWREESTDAAGNVISYRGYEHIRAWSLGVSAATLVDQVASMTGRHSSLADWADVAFGVSRKRVAMALYPPEVFVANTNDLGVLARVSPLDTRRVPGSHGGRTHRLDLSFAHSVLNANDAMIDFGFFGPQPTSRLKRNGGAAGWTMRAAPEALQAGARLRRIVGPDDALLRVLVAFDHEHVSAGDNEANAYDVNRLGAEAALGRVAALRLGHVSDKEGEIDGIAWGFGLGAPLGPLAELAYDFASTPQATGLDHRESHSVTLRLDVLGTLRSWREEGGHANAH